MHIPGPVVLTNDDGIDAAGLRALAGAVAGVCDEVYIVAPNRGYSGCSQQVTMHQPIPVEQRGPREFAVGGSPADCVRLAITAFAPGCRLVLSGINHGGNMGHDIYLSGTVGAAREAALLGIDAVAISHYLRAGLPLDWPRAAAWALAAVNTLFASGSAGGRLWNINLPHLEPEFQGVPSITPCRPCSRPLPVAYTRENGVFHYDAGKYHTRIQEAGTDVSICFGGAIAVSALSVGFTSPRP